MMNGLQSFGNYFGDELRKTPGDPDGAYNRAFERATVSGVFSGAAWAAFPAGAFQGPLKNVMKNIMFQAFGVQPAINMGHQAADNALTGKPLAEGLGKAYTQGAIGTLPIAVGHYLGGEAVKVVSQYKLQVDPNSIGANGGNIRIVKKAGTWEPSEQPNVVNDGKNGFKLNKKRCSIPRRLRGSPNLGIRSRRRERPRPLTLLQDTMTSRQFIWARMRTRS
jgi:hypothetical protein